MNNLIPILTINKDKKNVIQKLNSFVLQGHDAVYLSVTDPVILKKTYENIQELQLEVQQFCTDKSIYFNKINAILNDIRVSFINKNNDYIFKNGIDDWKSIKDNMEKIKMIIYEFQQTYYIFTVLLPITYTILILLNFILYCNFIYLLPIVLLIYGFCKLNWFNNIKQFLNK